MDKGELRLGNYVRVTKPGGYNRVGDIVQVREISEEGINHWQDMGASGCNSFDGICGIPLTADWIENAGILFEDTTTGVKYIELTKFLLLIPVTDYWALSISVEHGLVDLRNRIALVYEFQNLWYDHNRTELIFNT
jgi:hypothetical protein